MDTEKFLEDKKVTKEELQETKEKLPKDQRLVEVSPDHFKVLTRLKE